MQAELRSIKAVETAARAVAEAHDADIFIMNSPIRRDMDDEFIDLVDARKVRPNVLLLLTTEGGDPNAAYRIMRHLQRTYVSVTMVVGGYCKSAGTLMALGAHRLVLSAHGELGPLDVQMGKQDEIAEMVSGLTHKSTLGFLQREMRSLFDEHFVDVKLKTGLSAKTAADIALRIAANVFTPILDQIDPMWIGEAERNQLIGVQYGIRLAERGRNCKGGATQRIVFKLAASYPSHGFVIDREEAATLFETVQDLDGPLATLMVALGSVSQWPGPTTLLEALHDDAEQPPDEAAALAPNGTDGSLIPLDGGGPSVVAGSLDGTGSASVGDT